MVLARRLQKIEQVVSQRQAGLAVVIEDIHDPHNAEAIFRTCDAFGVQEVYLIFEQQKPWNPKTIGKQSSSSAHKWLTFHTFRSTKECFAVLKEKGYFLLGTALSSSAQDLFSFDCREKKIALVVGNEHKGLSAYALQQVDAHVMIPMRGMVESLNVSVATALFLYELTRQRVHGDRFAGISHAERPALIDDFTRRSSKRKTREP